MPVRWPEIPPVGAGCRSRGPVSGAVPGPSVVSYRNTLPRPVDDRIEFGVIPCPGLDVEAVVRPDLGDRPGPGRRPGRLDHPALLLVVDREVGPALPARGCLGDRPEQPAVLLLRPDHPGQEP